MHPQISILLSSLVFFSIGLADELPQPALQRQIAPIEHALNPSSLANESIVPQSKPTVTSVRTNTDLTERGLGMFFSSLRSLFAKHYPAVACSIKDEIMTFDSKTRLFTNHEPLESSDGQEAKQEQRPTKSGIYCEIVLRKGPYRGAAVVPQIFARHDYSVLLLAPYSERLGGHLHVLLSYPKDASKEFLREFKDAVNGFRDY